MKTSKEYIEERKQRLAEYKTIRMVLLAIVEDEKANDSDRIAAANMIYRIDENVLLLQKW